MLWHGIGSVNKQELSTAKAI